MQSASVFSPPVNTRDDVQSWCSNSVESTFLFIYVYLVALVFGTGERYQVKQGRTAELGRKMFKWKHVNLSCSVNYPGKPSLQNPLTVRHPSPTKFMFTKAQLNITQENSPSRDVRHIVHPQDQHRTTQFPVGVRKSKCLLKPEQLLIASHKISVSFPFLLMHNSFPFVFRLD